MSRSPWAAQPENEADSGDTWKTYVLAGFLWSLGDCIAQTIEKRTKKSLYPRYDYLRTIRVCTFAAFLATPLSLLWYNFLESTFPPPLRASVIAKRVICDQLVYSPVVLSLMYFSLSKMEGKSTFQARRKIYLTLWGTLKANWCVWPFVQMFNFGWCPPKYTLLVVNLVSIPWSAFLVMQSASGPLDNVDSVSKKDEGHGFDAVSAKLTESPVSSSSELP
eukprot:g16908.t1